MYNNIKNIFLKTFKRKYFCIYYYTLILKYLLKLKYLCYKIF